MLTLLYDGHELGTIKVSEKDFPTTVGVFTPKDNSDEWASAMMEIVKNYSGGKFDGISEDCCSALAVRQEAEVILVEWIE